VVLLIQQLILLITGSVLYWLGQIKKRDRINTPDPVDDKPDGIVTWFVMNPDDKKEWIGLPVFENKEAFVKNVNSPDQHQSFLEIMEHLAKEPSWTDGTYVIGDLKTT